MKTRNVTNTKTTTDKTEFSDILDSLTPANRRALKTFAGYLTAQQAADPLHGLSIKEKLSMLSHDDLVLLDKVVDHYLKPDARNGR